MSAPRQSGLPELTDAEVVRLAQHGDAAAFERIYQLHSRRVYSLCLRMVGDPTEAEDLTQDVFLQLFRKIDTFRGESAFSTWLHRMSVNIVLMRFRKKPIAQTSLDAISNSQDESSAAPPEPGGPDLHLSGFIDRVTLQAAINELPAGYKSMFILHDIQGYKHSEIAEIFGCSVGNSKSQVHKARMRLRELLLAPAFATVGRHDRSSDNRRNRLLEWHRKFARRILQRDSDLRTRKQAHRTILEAT